MSGWIFGCRQIYYTANALTFSRGRNRNVDDIGGIARKNIAGYPTKCLDLRGFMLMAKYSSKQIRPCIYNPLGALAIMKQVKLYLNKWKTEYYL